MPVQSFIAMNASGANDSAITESACMIRPEESHESIMPWLYLSLALLGLPTNGIVLLDLWRSERTPTVIFTLNIVVSDLMLCCSFFLRVAYYKNNVKWPSGSSVCNAVDLIMFSCFYVNLYCNMCFLLWTSINRYATVVNPVYALFRVFKHPKPCWIICLLTWLVVASIVITSLVTKLSLRITNETCFDQVVNSFNLNKIKFISVHSIGVAGFFFISFLMLVSYGLLVFYLQRVRGGSLISAGFGPGGGLKVRRKILASVILFVLCFLPYHIQRIIILQSDGGDCQAEFRIKTITIFIAAISSCLQPVLQLVLRLRCCRAKRNARAKPKPEISKSLATPNINTINLIDNAVRQTEKTKNNKGELSTQPTQ